ncbi:MAG: hypothetical protein ACOYMG_12295 [Candidatus Methylumidiphilus sp.]
MRIIGSLALTVAILFMVGCASHINKEVSQDYGATGVTTGVSAYVYANHTVIEFDKEPSLAWLVPPIISITDEDNQVIGYERLGRFCRLNRKYDYFKLRVNDQLTAFFLNNKSIPTTVTNHNQYQSANPNQQANQNLDRHSSMNRNPKNTRHKGIF